jgi:hypothetical protein
VENDRGWIFGSEESGYDRFIMMHDTRFGSTNGVGHIAMAIGTTWESNLGVASLGEWLHVAAVWRQYGSSYIYLNGVESNVASTYTQNNAMPDSVTIGRPAAWDGHWVNCDISLTRIYNRDLSHEEILTNFAAGNPINTDVPTSAPSGFCVDQSEKALDNLLDLVRQGQQPCFADMDCESEMICEDYICLSR